ncbi:MAG: SdrD B-like domain-containing protein, partial [Planctomycetota bacterium]
MKFLFPWKWKSNDRTAGTASSSRAATRLGMETMEPRCLLTVNPINIGAVYIEQDIGTDDTGDSFLVTFDGGVPETELRRLTIDGDQQISGFGVGDVFFDVDTQGLGADQSFDFQVTNQAGIDQVVATVADGGTRLVIDLVGFDAGEVLEFSIDVDEVEDYDPDEPNLEILNESFDPITSGVEFQGSLLTAEFHAPDFYDISGTAEFRNRYDDALADSGLALPADNANGQRDRTAGAFIAVTQAPIPVSISGYVYHDRDLDGQRDAGEEGLAGVQVQVIPVETATAQAVVTVFTNAEGFYEAPELSPGTYRVVEVTQPAPFLDGLDTVGTVAGSRSGRLAAEGDAFVDVVMRGGQEGVEYNFGEVLPMTVRGRVQLSTRDGDCFGADEQHEPVAGAVVELLDAAGNVLETTRTDADGRYAFADLRPGTYGVRELTPEGLIDGGARSGSLEGRRVGEVAAAGLVTNLVALSGQVIDNVDFCEHLPAEIGGTVYHDRDDNGQRARDEEGIAGVMVALLDDAGQEVARQRTDAEGRYHFDGLRAGTYSVVESQPAGWLDGKDQVGTIRGTRVGVAANDRVDQVQLRWGDQGHDYDFGELRAVGIRGRVQLSTADGDCFTGYENHEPVGGAQVELLDGTGQVLETTLTDANGEYAFEGLRPGTYAVREITPDGLIQGGARPGQVGATAVGAVNAQGVVTHLVTLSGQLVERVDFCEHLPAGLSGNVYHDRNDDGQRQVGEEGISNVLVRLLDAAGQEVARQRTNAEGGYQFEGLRAGTYTVLEEHPAEWLDGKDTVGQVGGTRVGRATNDRLDGVELRWGDEGRDYNFGEFLGSTLRGRVQLSDQDGNCFGARENHQPLADVLVTLFDAEGRTVAQTRTNAEGDYAFYNLQPGTYSIFEQTPAGLFDAGAQAGGLAETIVGQVVDPNTIRDITIRSDQQLTNYDFCEFPPATLKGTVYHDANGSGQQDRGENGIAGVVVQLIDEQGRVVAEATTDEEGCYEFINIRQGTYRVMELHPEGWLDGIDSPGIIGGRSVGRAENPGDKINDIDIRWGDIGTQFDFGEQLAGSISGFVHADLIRDCVYQPEEGEFRLAGVEIQLWDADGQWI